MGWVFVERSWVWVVEGKGDGRDSRMEETGCHSRGVSKGVEYRSSAVVVGCSWCRMMWSSMAWHHLIDLSWAEVYRSLQELAAEAW